MLAATSILVSRQTAKLELPRYATGSKSLRFYKTLGINYFHKQEPGLNGTTQVSVIANLLFPDSNPLQAFWILINILFHMYEYFMGFFVFTHCIFTLRQSAFSALFSKAIE